MALDLPSYLLGKSKGGGGGTSNYNELSNKPSINNVTLTGDKSLDDLGIETIQYSTMPTASADYTGKIVQYVGTSISGSYQNGYFYACVEDGGTYSWENINVQASSGGSSAVIVTGTNYNEQAVITAVNAEFQKFLNGEDYNIWGYRDNFLAPMFFAKTLTGYNLSSPYINSGTAEGGGTKTYRVYSPLTITSNVVTNVNRPSTLMEEFSPSNMSGFYIKTGNTKGYIPSSDFNPTPKLYVDNDIISKANGIELYNDSQTYSVDDIVYYHGNFSNQWKYYKCILDAPTYTYPSNTTYWTEITLTADQQRLTTKEYVDGLVGNINTVLATLTTPSNNGGN